MEDEQEWCAVLQGTFETLTLTELLTTLAAAAKTGVLELEAPDADARIYLVDGRCVAVEAEQLSGPLERADALTARLTEACFAVARHDDGTFRFIAEALAPWTVDDPVELATAVVAVDELVEQWDQLRAVIPSLDAHPRLQSEIAEPLTLAPSEWELVVAIDGRRSVRDVVDRSRGSVLDVCRAIAALVEHGAIEIDPPRPRTPLEVETARSRAALEAVTAALPLPRGTAAELTDPWAPGVDARYEELHRRLAEQELVPADPTSDADDLALVADDDPPTTGSDADVDDGRDRRALLRLFSALREG
ncbi:MAG TPA: DUF4388 domain-containing protein [Acidimicrobiia bacterium]|nr:DUF4388 domain-containing protein [Acidimicrobiia bacterium]